MFFNWFGVIVLIACSIFLLISLTNRVHELVTDLDAGSKNADVGKYSALLTREFRTIVGIVVLMFMTEMGIVMFSADIDNKAILFSIWLGAILTAFGLMIFLAGAIHYLLSKPKAGKQPIK